MNIEINFKVYGNNHPIIEKILDTLFFLNYEKLNQEKINTKFFSDFYLTFFPLELNSSSRNSATVTAVALFYKHIFSRKKSIIYTHYARKQTPLNLMTMHYYTLCKYKVYE